MVLRTCMKQMSKTNRPRGPRDVTRISLNIGTYVIDEKNGHQATHHNASRPSHKEHAMLCGYIRIQYVPKCMPRERKVSYSAQALILMSCCHTHGVAVNSSPVTLFTNVALNRLSDCNKKGILQQTISCSNGGIHAYCTYLHDVIEYYSDLISTQPQSNKSQGLRPPPARISGSRCTLPLHTPELLRKACKHWS